MTVARAPLQQVQLVPSLCAKHSRGVHCRTVLYSPITRTLIPLALARPGSGLGVQVFRKEVLPAQSRSFRRQVVKCDCNSNGQNKPADSARAQSPSVSADAPLPDSANRWNSALIVLRRAGLILATVDLLISAVLYTPPALAAPIFLSPHLATISQSETSTLRLSNAPGLAAEVAVCDVKGEQPETETVAEPAEEAVTPESVVAEAWKVVDENYLDARNKGFNREAWAKQKEEAFHRPIRSRMAAYSAIRGMLGSLNDPFTRFLSPEQFRELSKYDISGIGLNMGEVDEQDGSTHLRVIGIVLDSAVAAAGVRQGDELLAVDGESVVGKSAFEASSRMQGPVGSPVVLDLRNSCGEPMRVTVPRGMEARSPVMYRLERGTDDQPVGYIRLREFNALARKEVVTAVERLREEGARSFVLDLQDNPGGLVQAGVEIARLFLDSNEVVVYTKGRSPETLRSIVAAGPPLTKAPLLILVNDHTASASEIVAGALHDNCRALLVGKRTYGKGLIQSVYELSDGSGVVLTVGKYVTPSNVDIDGNGIEPDFVRDSGLWMQRPTLPDLKEVNKALAACRPPQAGSIYPLVAVE